MKIGIISDIHLDINSDFDIISALDEVSRQQNCDMVLIAGDIHSNAYKTVESIEKLNSLGSIVYKYVPGNHDLWNDNIDIKSTDDIYKIFLNDKNCLCKNPVELDNWVIVGDVGWYDYSFGNSDIYTFEEFEKMKLDDKTWQDSIKNCWTKNNKSRTLKSLNSLEILLEKYKNKNKIVVTHMLPVKEFCVNDGRVMWQYFNAFLGSSAYEELYKKYNVNYAVCGHVHYRKTIEKNKTVYMCRCLNYHKEWQGEADAKLQIEKAMDYIQI